MKYPIFILAGTTASGKSAIGMAVARLKKNVVIVNCDSKQVYKEIPIITAQPTFKEQLEIPHALYGVTSVTQHWSMTAWLTAVIPILNQLHQAQKIPLLIGGTGLYIKALMQGVTTIPSIDPDLRQHIRKEADTIGSQAFYEKLQRKDPVIAARLDPGDRQRVMRAYEVIEQTGQSLLSWQEQQTVPFYDKTQFRLFFLDTDRKQSYQQCHDRFYHMLEQGVMQEISDLNQLQLDSSLPAMKAHGVPELLAYLQGHMCLEKAVEQSIRNTRHYIKRQLTWFRGQMQDAITLAPPLAVETLLAELTESFATADKKS